MITMTTRKESRDSKDSPSSPFFIETPEELADKKVFAELVRYRYGVTKLAISSLTVRPLSDAHAILSKVVELTVEYDPPLQNLPTVWIAKFLKASLPLQDMFRVEGKFYSKYASSIRPQNKKDKNNVSPSFDVPRALYCGTQCIILEKIISSKYDLLQSCPKDKIETAVRAMAEMHARFWNHSKRLDDLSNAAGMGTALSGIDKERLFGKRYEEFLDQFNGTSTFGENGSLLQSRLQSICRTFSMRRLRDIHAMVHETKPTLIHGDYHVGNLLFSVAGDGDNVTSLWILDWATCGAGNPIIDLVFFFLVSTRLTMKEMVQKWLHYYYQVLTNNKKCVEKDFPWTRCCLMFRTCLINQFLILVCYDQVSKTLISSEGGSSKTRTYFTKHFANVNQRCVEALLSNELNLVEFTMPPIKTDVEWQEEEAYHAEQTVLQDTHVIREI